MKTIHLYSICCAFCIYSINVYSQKFEDSGLLLTGGNPANEDFTIGLNNDSTIINLRMIENFNSISDDTIVNLFGKLLASSNFESALEYINVYHKLNLDTIPDDKKLEEVELEQENIQNNNSK